MSSHFLYDLDQLSNWAKRIQSSMPAGAEIYYACKANPLSHILQVLAEQGFGFDLASPGELRQAKRMAPQSRTLCTGPYKPASFLRDALLAGVDFFVLESPKQLEDLELVCKEEGLQAKALLRLQLDWEAGSSVLGGSEISVFGMDPPSWKDVLANVKLERVQIEGVHVFQWGNENNLGKLENRWVKIAREAAVFCSETKIPFRILDLGGGIGLPYQGGEILSPEAIGLSLARIQSLVPQSKLILELGRYLVGPCGTYTTKILDRKSVRGRQFLLTAGGAQHLLRPALVGEKFPGSLQRKSEAPLQRFQVHGPLCTALDCLGEYELPADTRAGDKLELQFAGAYGFTESMPFFLCHEGASELVRRNGEVKVVRNPFLPEEWLR